MKDKMNPDPRPDPLGHCRVQLEAHFAQVIDRLEVEAQQLIDQGWNVADLTVMEQHDGSFDVVPVATLT